MVVQSNEFNNSDIRTVLVSCLTTNLDRANAPGNVSLATGEGDLPEQSVVNVPQTFTMDEGDLDDRRGGLDHVRMRDVVAAGRTSDPTVGRVVTLAAAFGVAPSHLVDGVTHPSVLHAGALEVLKDETAGAILRESTRLPEREKQLVLGIVRRFAGGTK